MPFFGWGGGGYFPQPFREVLLWTLWKQAQPNQPQACYSSHLNSAKPSCVCASMTFTDTPDCGERNAQSTCYQSRVAGFSVWREGCWQVMLTDSSTTRLAVLCFYVSAEGVTTYMGYSWRLMNKPFSIFNAFQIVFSPAKSFLKMSAGHSCK